ncbi:MAG: Holliday junction branch migration DNA helicase RuvB [Patescibacteria group bacterium]
MEPKLEHNNEEQVIDVMLRPQKWDEYVGQERVKDQLHVILTAAKQRGEPCDHLLFYGQAGLGKTTLAHLVAQELGANCKVTSGPTLERVADLAAVLTNLDSGDVLFIDEAHRLNRMIEEVLYPAMEARKLNIMVGKGPGARSVALDLPPFTLVAATTRANLLSGPLRSRFGASFKLDYYELPDIEKILFRSADILGMSIDAEATKILAAASRFTPRSANRLLRRSRDYAQVSNETRITASLAQKTLDLLEIDSLGLDTYDRRLLRTIIEKFHGGPVGLGTLAAALNDDKGNIEEVYEPYLMSIGLLVRTSSGRMVADEAYTHLKKELPDSRLL